MADTFEVYIEVKGETRLVALCRYFQKHRSQSSLFEYANEWLDDDNAFAIDPANLPLQPGPVSRSSEKSGLPGAIRDSAPDRWGQQLIKRALRKAGAQRALTEVDYLLAINDGTRIGALRYKRVGEQTFDHDIGIYREPPLIRLPALVNAANAVLADNETAEDLRLLLNEGSPLGGARPKSAVQDKDGSLVIAKFPKPDDDRSIPHGEVLAMQLAKQAGLNVASARLQDVNGRPVALIKRFDRVAGQRIPFVSAITMLGMDDGDQATYTDIAEIIRMYSRKPIADLHELFKRVVFNIRVSNLDDHLRNHGFLYAGDGKWRLSPAYDLNPVPVEDKARELSTWISDESPEASLELAVESAKYFGLEKKDAVIVINSVGAAMANWHGVARQLGMGASDIGVYQTAINTERFQL